MEKTISRILEIEEKAKIILDRTNEQKTKLHDEFELEIAMMEKEISDKNASKIREFKAVMDNNYNEEELVLLQKSEHQLQELEELYTKQHTDLVEQVFESILRS